MSTISDKLSQQTKGQEASIRDRYGEVLHQINGLLTIFTASHTIIVPPRLVSHTLQTSTFYRLGIWFPIKMSITLPFSLVSVWLFVLLRSLSKGQPKPTFFILARLVYLNTKGMHKHCYLSYNVSLSITAQRNKSPLMEQFSVMFSCLCLCTYYTLQDSRL